MEIPKAYNPADYEDKIYKDWEEGGLFNPDNLKPRVKGHFSVVLPPPNVTGTLHLGHAAMLAIEDLMIRYKRMRGFDTVWIPGTDHAAIATQNVVEKKLFKEEKKTRHDLGREKFLARVEEHVENSKNVIHNQLRKMGSSLDWGREAYTLDEVRSRAVKKVFKQMYDDGLIYRGYRIVNWCPRCHSTLADDEVDYKDEVAKVYTFKYDKNFPFAIATTRPETKLGDTAVAVHPDDERYAEYVGKTFVADFCGVKLNIKVIADVEVEKAFGTGALGVTPAHSLIDYEMAQKNKLPIIKVIDEDGKITATGLPAQSGGKFVGLGAVQAREKIVAELRASGLLEKEEDLPHSLSVCYRCKTVVEPLPSDQWFVNVSAKCKVQSAKLRKIVGKREASLKEVALAVVKKGAIKIIPERFEKTYCQWMENLHDWCISRQIWFGHRIPVWYREASEIIVMRHGEALNNSLDKLNSDVKNEENGLTEKGIEQVVIAAEELADEKIDLIITSDFTRTKQTAAIVAKRLGVIKIIEDKRLRECGMGEFEGKSATDFATFRQADFEAWRSKSPRGIESFESVRQRVFDFLADIKKKYADKRVLIVTHGDVARVIPAFEKGMNDADIYKFGIPRTAGFAKVKLGKEEIKVTEESPGVDWRQDEDTLDTWFSSGLWTFTTLLPPDWDGKKFKSKEIKRFHPTTVLETGYDILPFWVARMILMTTYVMDDVPFENVYLHGLIRDKDGDKMSKSKPETAIDPLDAGAKYGFDAVRLSLLIGNTAGNDIRVYDEKIESYRNFVNKLWNISRFILTVETQSLDSARDDIASVQMEKEKYSLADRWIMSEFNHLKENVILHLDKYNFSGAGDLLRDFTWNKFADWYLEVAKCEGNKDKILRDILHDLLKLWHPFVPFVTEAIWQEMGERESIMISQWPVGNNDDTDDIATEWFETIQQIIVGIRNVRSQYNIPYSKELEVVIAVDRSFNLVVDNAETVKMMTKLKDYRIVQVTADNPFVKPAGYVSGGVFAHGNIFVNVADAVDFGKEKERLGKEKANLANYISGLEKKLNNAEFVKNAPVAVVEGERAKLAEAKDKLKKVEEQRIAVIE